MLCPLARMCCKITQISLQYVFNIMEIKHHGPLKSGSRIFKAKGNLFLCKGSPRTNKSYLILVLGLDFYLLIAKKIVHERENLTSYALVMNLIDKWCTKVILRTIIIQIMKIHAYSNCALFLVHLNGIGYPFCQWEWIDKSCFEQFLYLSIDHCFFPWVNWSQFFSNKISVFVIMSLVFENSSIYFGNFLIQPSENITKFPEKCRILANFILRSICPNKDVFYNIKGPKNVDRNGL
jgi:hypothetical protein